MVELIFSNFWFYNALLLSLVPKKSTYSRLTCCKLIVFSKLNIKDIKVVYLEAATTIKNIRCDDMYILYFGQFLIS